MSKRNMEVLVDDIDGTPIVSETQGRTIPVRIGDVIDTELDLTNEHIEKLEALFRDFVSPASNGTQSPTRTTATSSADISRIREWARKNGHKVNARGRIPFSVMDAFARAHAS